MYKGFWGTVYAVLKLMRWFHELVAVLPFVSLYFVLRYHAQKNNVAFELHALDFVALCVCVQALIAAGCVLNDIADRDIDKINKPQSHIIANAISLRGAWFLFACLTVIIVGLSFYISRYLFIEWAFISTAVYGLSFAYDFYLKRSPLLGNLFMGVLTAFIPLILFYYAKDCIAAIPDVRVSLLIYLYAALPFLIIVPRELSLDISDMEGDKAAGCNTLPILIGVKKSRLAVVCLLLLIPILSAMLFFQYRFLWPALLLINALICAYLFLFRRSTTRIEYIRIGRFLWAIMIVGLLACTYLCL